VDLNRGPKRIRGTPDFALSVFPNYARMGAMKTTVNIPDRELEEAMASIGARTKKEAVVAALVEFNRRRRLEGLAAQLGTFEGFPTPEDIESLRGEG
jgi:hypothetical protein